MKEKYSYDELKEFTYLHKIHLQEIGLMINEAKENNYKFSLDVVVGLTNESLKLLDIIEELLIVTQKIEIEKNILKNK